MINKLPQSEGNTIGLVVSGKVDSEEENTWIAMMNQLIAEHGKVNVLVQLDGRLQYAADAAYDDLKWMFKHVKNLNKIAIVADSKVLGALVAVDSVFAKMMGIGEKYFDSSELTDAWSWIKT